MCRFIVVDGKPFCCCFEDGVRVSITTSIPLLLSAYTRLEAVRQRVCVCFCVIPYTIPQPAHFLQFHGGTSQAFEQNAFLVHQAVERDLLYQQRAMRGIKVRTISRRNLVALRPAHTYRPRQLCFRIFVN